LPGVYQATRSPVTTSDIARVAAVSRITVSRVLNNHANVTNKMRQRVLQAAADVGYISHQSVPAGLATNSGPARPLVVLRTIGFLFASLQGLDAATSNPFWSPVLHGVEQEASAAGITVIYQSINQSLGEPEAQIGKILTAPPDGILLVGPASAATIEALTRTERPLVLVENDVPSANVDAVVSDSFAGARAAVAHLIDAGHREIAFIGGPFTVSPPPVRHRANSVWSIEQRALGYWTALREAGVQPDYALYEGDNLSTAGGYRACNRLLAARRRFSAIFCANDETAVGAMRALHEANLTVPSDVSVVGFDDIAVAAHLIPPLTTLRVQKEAIGAWAVRRLVERALAPHTPATTLTIRAELIQRGTVAHH
jgi:DNA-binding LacI/PurR family transcriptional regulator